MSTVLEATFTGFIHSTRDALLIFEAVRRGILPKITRRLRDDERKTIRSGTVFVFDESEANIKRWTDGMIWSPSRILNNFLVYREVEKKDPKPPTDQPAFANSQPGFPLPGPPLDDRNGQYNHTRPVPLTLASSSMDADQSISLYHPQTGFNSMETTSSYTDNDRFYNGTHAQAAGMVGMAGGNASPNQGRRDPDLDRNIVGSLTNSYPFVRDGLCKKTISINVEGSTQHLISYYTIDDVQNQRLTVPSNLPEIASLSISPIFLNKINFRYPPVVDFGPDGIPRYVGESTESNRTPGHVSSGTDSYTPGSESRHDAGSSRGLVLYSPTAASDTSMPDPHYRFPHQIGGSGILASPTAFTPPQGVTGRARRPSSEVNRKRSNSRYEPYSHVAAPGTANWPQQTYSPGLDLNGSGRRSMAAPQRGYADFSPNQQDNSVFSVGQMMHTDNHSASASGSHFGATLPSIGHLSQSSGMAQHPSFALNSPTSTSTFPTVPSQPTRAAFGYGEQVQTKSEYDGKADGTDMFHFNSSRLPRGSWDSNHPPQRMHQVHAPPATSQGLTAMSLYSQPTFNQTMYDREPPTPPEHSSSHDSRQSVATGMPAAVRIEELIDHSNTSTANNNQQLDVSDASRFGLQTEDRYTSDSARMTSNSARAQSGPSSPFTRSAFQSSAASPSLQSRSVNDLRLQQHPSSYSTNSYSQQQSQTSTHSAYSSEVDGQTQNVAVKQEPNWQSDTSQDDSNHQPDSQHNHFPPLHDSDNAQHRAKVSDDDPEADDCRSGFERVMLARPAS